MVARHADEDSSDGSGASGVSGANDGSSGDYHVPIDGCHCQKADCYPGLPLTGGYHRRPSGLSELKKLDWNREMRHSSSRTG